MFIQISLSYKNNHQEIVLKLLSLNILLKMFNFDSKESASSFITENYIYKLKCIYTKDCFIQFTVEIKKSFQQYYKKITEEDMAKGGLQFYGNLQRLYNFIKKQPNDTLSFVSKQKIINIKDNVGVRPIYIKITNVEQKKLTEIEIAQKKINKDQRKIKELQIQVSKLKSQNAHMGKIIAQYQNREIDISRQNRSLRNMLKRLEDKLAQTNRELLRLENKLRYFQKKEQQKDEFAITIRKRHIFNDMNFKFKEQISKYESSQNIIIQRDSEQQTQISPHQGQNLRPKTNEDQESQTQHPIYGKKIQIQPLSQRNSHKFIFKEKHITKNFGLQKGHAYFLQTETNLNKSCPKCHISLKNMTFSHISQKPNHSIILGVTIYEKNKQIIDCEQFKETVYFDAVRGISFIGESQQKIQNYSPYKENDIFTMVANIPNGQISWFLNDVNIKTGKISQKMSESNLIPFIQMNGKKSRVMIL